LFGPYVQDHRQVALLEGFLNLSGNKTFDRMISLCIVVLPRKADEVAVVRNEIASMLKEEHDSSMINGLGCVRSRTAKQKGK
jgi:hypothetical protein